MEGRTGRLHIAAAILAVAVLAFYGGCRYLSLRANEMLRDYAVEHDQFVSGEQQKELDDALRMTDGLPLILGNSADAGPLLEPHLRWDLIGAPAAANPKELPGAYVPAFDALTQHLEQWREHWFDHLQEVAAPKFDTRWFPTLLHFDHWAVEASPRLKSGVEGFPQQRIPRFRDLVTWSRIHMAQGFLGGDPQAVERELTRLAILLWSTERPDGATAALDIFRDLEHFNSLRPTAAAQPAQFLNRGQIAALEKALELAPRFLSIVTPAPILQGLFDSSGLRPVMCIVLNEDASLLLDQRLLLREAFAESSEVLGSIVRDQQSDCRIKVLPALTTAPDGVPASLGPAFYPRGVLIPGFGAYYRLVMATSRVFGYRGFLAAPLAYSSTIRIASGTELLREKYLGKR